MSRRAAPSKRKPGSHALEQFRDRRRRRIRKSWKDALTLLLIAIGSAATLIVLRGVPQVVAAFVLGFTVAIATVMWFVGDVYALPWLWGSVGEEQTAAVLGQLGTEWLTVHDVSRTRGNWDHICVGPSGVYMLETKNSSRPACVFDDALRYGRLRYNGGMFRRSVIELKDAIARQGVRAPYIHAVVVIWGEFAQRECVDENVTYVAGSELLSYLNRRPPSLTAERLERLRVAVGAVAAANGVIARQRTN